MKRPQAEVIRWAQLLEIERAAKAVALASIRTADHTKWFEPLSRLLGALGYPDKWPAGNGDAQR